MPSFIFISKQIPIMLSGSMLMLAPNACAQGIDYILDSGIGSVNIGPSLFDANMTWLNAFDTVPGGEWITSIRVSYGGIDDNDGNTGSDQVTLAILDDPNNDGNPGDARLLRTATGTWAETGFGEFVSYSIDPTRVDGVFFVAVVMDVIGRASPASGDPNPPDAGTRSWLFFNPKNNLQDLGSSPFILRMADGPFVSTWLVRAHGQNAPACRIDFNGDAKLDFFDVSLFLSLYNSSDPRADLSGDGTLDFFDISSFLTQFGQGCPE